MTIEEFEKMYANRSKTTLDKDKNEPRLEIQYLKTIMKARTTEDKRIEWFKYVGNKIYTIRKLGYNKFKLKWAKIEYKPCCKSNQGTHWDSFVLADWDQLLEIIIEFKLDQ